MPAYTSNIPPVILLGTRTGYPWLQRGYSYGKNDSGPFQTWITKGRTADVDVDAVWFWNQGWTLTVTRDGHGISTMEAHAGWAPNNVSGINYNNSEAPENIWELDPQDADKNLLEADFPNAPALALSSKKTRDALKKLTDSSSVVQWETATMTGTYGKVTTNPGSTGLFTWYFDDGAGGPDNPSEIHLPSADYDPSYSLYLLMKAGVSNFQVDTTTIKHTQLVSNLWTLQASFNNVNRIISSASMYSVEGVPSDILFGVPNPSAPTQFIETAGDLQYGWKKIRPSVSRMALFKWKIGQNYQWGLWPIKLFGSVL